LKISWKHSLATKLFVVISLTVLATVVVIAGRNAVQFRSILETQLTEKNVSMAQNSLNSISSRLKMWLGQITQAMRFIATFKKQRIDSYLTDLVKFNKEFLGFHLIKTAAEKPSKTISFAFSTHVKNPNFGAEDPLKVKEKLYELGLEKIKELSTEEQPRSMYFINAAQKTGVPVMMILVPAKTGEKSYNWGILTVWQESLMKSLESDPQTKSFVIDAKGGVLISANTEDNTKPGTYKNLDIVKIAIKGKSEAGKKNYIDESGQEILSAYSHSMLFRISVVYLKDPSLAYAQITNEVIKTILITAILFLFVVLISFHAAGRVTANLRRLVDATKEIAKGNFNTEVKLGTKDEVDALGGSISSMSTQIQDLLESQVEAARQDKELETAKAVQETLFPKEDISVSDIMKVTGSYYPASECGGDWWGHFSAGDDIEFICVADATGHGAPAALVTAIAYSSCMMISETSEAANSLKFKPEIMLERLNKVMWSAGRGITTMTFFASFVNLKTGEIIFANAGHNLPFIISSLEEDPRIKKSKSAKAAKRYINMKSSGTPLGMAPESTYNQYRMQLYPGDKLFYFSDGLIECKSPQEEMFGKRRMMNLAEKNADKTYAELKANMLKEAFDFYQDRILDDDITVVVTEFSKDWKPEINSEA
jgi:serine phosphatase RsbU (regulator of sigma subunit)